MNHGKNVISLFTPLLGDEINTLQVGDMISISGEIYTGRDAVLPKLRRMIEQGAPLPISLKGSVIFHTAVSPAGVGPTSSNKLEIESSFESLSRAGVKIHLGKGEISRETIMMLDKNEAVYAVIPPVTALLEAKIQKKQVAAFEEEGMEAVHRLIVSDFPMIIAAAHGESIYGGEKNG